MLKADRKSLIIHPDTRIRVQDYINSLQEKKSENSLWIESVNKFLDDQNFDKFIYRTNNVYERIDLKGNTIGYVLWDSDLKKYSDISNEEARKIMVNSL